MGGWQNRRLMGAGALAPAGRRVANGHKVEDDIHRVCRAPYVGYRKNNYTVT